MPWNTLAASDVTVEISPDEVTALNTIEGSNAVLAAILGTVLAGLQAQILVGGNQIGPAGTIPDQIRGEAIAIARWRWFCSLPKTDLQSESRKAQYDSALERMATIMQGKEKTEIPASPQNVAGPSFRVTVAREGRQPHGFDKISST